MDNYPNPPTMDELRELVGLPQDNSDILDKLYAMTTKQRNSDIRRLPGKVLMAIGCGR